MPTKTDRILSYLPNTFSALPKPTALHSVADAFGNELQQAENSLAALMMSHWVDMADRGEEMIQDLACIAALYGLAPRSAGQGGTVPPQSTVCRPFPSDESVEEFREHLKRHVRTFLEGTVTVRGILRVTAEALGLRIEDDEDRLDVWWKRDHDSIISIAPRGDDAADLLLGVLSADIRGAAARPAQVVGSVDLPDLIDLGTGMVLRIAVDDVAAIDVELPESATPDEIRQTINSTLAAADAKFDQVASLAGRRLTLTSPTIGAGSRLEVSAVTGDASPLLLGLPSRVYNGAAATSARVRSIDLGEIDLRQARYLRLIVDGQHSAEVDCAGVDAAHTTPAEIIKNINDAFKTALGTDLATLDGNRLTLTSPTAGFNSSIAFISPAAQDARESLFGSIARFHTGRNARPAQIVGSKDLSLGVDLSRRSRLSLRLDSQAQVTVDVAGANPVNTSPAEIAAALNARLGAGVASSDGRFISIVSRTAGPEGFLAIELSPVEEDAAELIFGIGTRSLKGADATSAQITGVQDLSHGVDLGALYTLRIGLDGDGAREVNVGAPAANRSSAKLAEITRAINDAFGLSIASDDGERLVLKSLTAGPDSRIVIEPLEVVRQQRFVTRAFTSGEAAQLLFGFNERRAQGLPGTASRVAGEADLSRGVDLNQSRLLRLAAGDQAIEIDCAGARPRVTTLDEIIHVLNLALDGHLSLKADSDDRRRLVLTALVAGAGQNIQFEPPRGVLQTLFGAGPQTIRGADARGVNFTGIADLSAGVELVGDGSIKIGVDDQPLIQIACAHPPETTHGELPAEAQPGHPDHDMVEAPPPHHIHHVTLDQIALAINIRLGSAIASHDGKHIKLVSLAGAASRITFETPSGPDSTEKIFGIKPPRTYLGATALPARIESFDLSPGADLRGAHVLRIAAGGGQPIEIDCAAGIPVTLPNGELNPERQAVTPEKIAQTIDGAFKAAGVPASATTASGRLIIASNATGASARLDLLASPGDDAREKLFGKNPTITPGSDPVPATIEGEVDLLAPVDLTERHTIRLAMNGASPVEIDVAGSAPGTTTLEEIIARVNAVFPGMASVTADDRLLLTALSGDESSSLELLPTRWLELIEYPPRPASFSLQARHGETWAVSNGGAAEAPLIIELRAAHGIAGPSFVNRTTGLHVQLDVVLRPGEAARVWRALDGMLGAAVVEPDGVMRELPAERIIADHPAILSLPPGSSEWSYLDCDGARFDQASFNHARFAGGLCIERGVFDISRFTIYPPDTAATVFAFSIDQDPKVEIQFRWMQYQPGAFIVNLPADLPERFGGRFNQARFGSGESRVESFPGAVTEPAGDPDHLARRINRESKLLVAQVVPRVELGFDEVLLPIRRPGERRLRGGDATDPARLYLREEGVPGFIRLTARRPGSVVDENDPSSIEKAMLPGPQGNAIAVTAQKAGPARFDVTVSYQGARFENARQTARGAQPAPVAGLLRPGPIGILQAKAAGISADVTRDGAPSLG